MCLIIVGKSNLIRTTLLTTPRLLEEIYHSNSDGLGVMYATVNAAKPGIKVRKWLPGSAKEARKCVASLPNDDREVAMHWRMRTHGDINLGNCHPYPVGDAGWLMHNGVLSIGNDKDKTRSDTSHYIERYVDPQAFAGNVTSVPYLTLLSDHIGSGNKFVLLSKDGRMGIAGRHRGIDLADLWWSNTYAWDPRLVDPSWTDPAWTKYASTYTGKYGGKYGGVYDDYDRNYGTVYGGSHGRDWLDEDSQDWTGESRVRSALALPNTSTPALRVAASVASQIEDEEDEGDYYQYWVTVLETGDVDTLACDLESDAGAELLEWMFEQGWVAKPYADLAEHDGLLQALISQDMAVLSEALRNRRHQLLSELMCYYVEWDFGAEEAPAESDADAVLCKRVLM